MESWPKNPENFHPCINQEKEEPTIYLHLNLILVNLLWMHLNATVA